MNEAMSNLQACVERLTAAASSMESVAALWRQCAEEQTGAVTKITAAVEAGDEGAESTRRERELQARLREVEGALEALRAESAPRAESRSEGRVARKTLPAATVQLLAKQGIDTADSVDVRSLDVALAGLSVENRIAVKSQLMRTGALTL